MPYPRVSLLAYVSLFALSACASPSAPAGEPGEGSLYRDYLTGRYAEMVNEPDEAAARYASALVKAPNDPILLQSAIESALVAGDMERAVAASKAAKDRGADIGIGRLTLATAALAAGRGSQARDQALLDSGPPFDRQVARVLRAWSFADEGKTDLALAVFSGPGDAAPFARIFDYQRGLILARAGRIAEAEAAFESAMQAGLRIAPAIIQHGALLERNGQRDTAISLYRAVLIGGHETSIEATLARAERGAPPPALSTPSEGAAMGLYSLAALLVGQTDAAFYAPYLTLALALQPDMDHAHLLFADAMAETSQYAAARAQLDMVAPTSPLYERAQVSKAFLLRQQDDKEGALASAREALEKTKGRTARLALADMLRAMEKWAEAELHYSELIASQAAGDESWRLYFARGAVRERQSKWALAEADLKKALELEPDRAEVLNYLGYSWVDQGTNLKEGLRMIERAAALEPDAGYIVDSLGWAHFMLGDYGKAVEYLERAAALSPEDAVLNDHLGDAYWRMGRKVEARFQWSRALTLEPAEADAARTKKKLAEGLPALEKRTVNAAPR